VVAERHEPFLVVVAVVGFLVQADEIDEVTHVVVQQVD
jgi:hypothetical protein